MANALVSQNQPDLSSKKPIPPASKPMQRAFGRGALTVKHKGFGNRIQTLYQEGSARLRMPKTLRGAPLEAVMINTSGGLTDGDRMMWDICVDTQASAVVTSQACERIYKAAHNVPAQIDIKINIGAQSRLAWLPQETILFDQSHLTRRLDVQLAEDSEFLLVEPIVFGRQAMNEIMHCVSFRDEWRISQAGRLVHAENQSFEGEFEPFIGSSACLNSNRAFASLIYIGSDCEAKLGPLRNIAGEKGSASLWNIGPCQKLVVRLMDVDSYHMRKTLLPIIACLNGQNMLPKTWSI